MEDNDPFEETFTDYIISGLDIMKKFRGEVIEKALQIENVIDETLANYFSKENKLKNNQFRKFMIDSRFCTSYRKIQIFNGLNLHKDHRFNGRYDKLVTQLRHFNESRNDLAHSLRDSYHHEFLMRWKGKKEIVKLDDDFLKEIENEFQKIITSLFTIAHELCLR